MSKKLFKLSFLFIFMITISSTTFSGLSQQESGFDQIHLGPGNELSEINFLVKHVNSQNRNDYAEFLVGLRETYGFDQEIIEPITNAELNGVDVTIIVNDVANSTRGEIDAVRGSLQSGKGLLFLAQSGNTSKSSTLFVTALFGTEVIKFTDYQINGTFFDTQLPYVITSEFNSPRTPVTQNITKLILPNSLGMSINYTAVSETNLSIKDIYPIIYDNNNTILGIAVELTNFGRLIFLGSRLMLSDDVILYLNNYSDFASTNNGQFGFNAITWLGMGSGFVKKYSHSLNVQPLQQIDRGFIINASILLKDANNNSFTNAEVALELELFNNILESSYMSLGDDNLYYGEVSTRNLLRGTYDEIRVSISKRGYIDQSFLIGRVLIIKDFSGASFPNLIILTILAGGILIFLYSYFLLWSSLKKVE